MNDDRKPSDRPQAQPWHPADEKKPASKHGPIGTHSFTGGNAEVGLPPDAQAADQVDDGGRDEPLAPGEPDLLKEPRAGRADLLGPKR